MILVDFSILDFSQIFHESLFTICSQQKSDTYADLRRTLVFFGYFRSEIQTWESTSFGAKLGKKRGNQQVFTK